LIISLTFILAYLSYKFIENTTRNFIHTPKIVLAGIGFIVGLTLFLQSDNYKPNYESKFIPHVYYLNYYDISPTPSLSNTDPNSPINFGVSKPARLPEFNDAYKKEGIITNNQNGTPKMIIIGDSHGVMWAKLIDEISNELKMTLSCYTSNASSPFFNIENIQSQEKQKHLQNCKGWNMPNPSLGISKNGSQRLL